jgi:ribosomal protein L30/L7E
VVRVEVEERVDVLDGKSIGAPGSYEKLRGKIHFAFDPKNAMNARIVDLDKAPINEEGRVEAWADFMVLRPKDASRGSGVGFVEVSNRGGKASLRYFNRAGRGTDPVEEADFGDALLLRRGWTVIWVGWQFDVPERENVLRLHVPIAKNGRKSIQGLVRCDWTVDQTVTTLGLGHRNHTPYTLVNPKDKENVLTERDGRLSPRRTVPRDQWRFAREEDGQVIESKEHIYMAPGFQAGKIYELVYRAKDPSVVGLGPAAIRDIMSYAKYNEDSLFPVEHGVAFGVSQTGRFLRHFLYQGFNTDEKRRKVYDGLLIHTAGAGRGSFNHRFGQPSRDAHRYSAFFYPTDIFPFTSWTQ